jgi:hypothetical protein
VLGFWRRGVSPWLFASWGQEGRWGVEKDVLRAGLTRVGVEGDKGDRPDRHSYSHELGGASSSRSSSSTSESGEDEAGGEAGGTCVPERSE